MGSKQKTVEAAGDFDVLNVTKDQCFDGRNNWSLDWKTMRSSRSFGKIIIIQFDKTRGVRI